MSFVGIYFIIFCKPISLRMNDSSIPVSISYLCPPVQPSRKPPAVNPLYESCKVMMFSENQEFSMDVFQEENQMKSEEYVQNQLLSPPEKKINYVKASLVMSKKYSASNCDNDDDRSREMDFDFLDDEVHYQKSFGVGEMAEEKEFVEKNRSQIYLQKFSQMPGDQDFQSYYMKKIRVLETKFKKYQLDAETEMMKLKNENYSLKNELTLLTKFLSNNYGQVQKHFQTYKDQLSVSESSSSSSSNDEKAMPVVSQIMELKLEGKKLCEKIKSLEKTIKLQKQVNKKMKDKFELATNYEYEGKNNQNRKWSIQELIRNKKSSFQLSKISTEAKEGKNEESSQVQNKVKCKKCKELKEYLLKLNKKLTKIKIQ